MRFRSKKMARLYVDRRALVVRILDEFPICQRCGTNPSQDCHEVLSRARGGSITDPENIRALCRRCHVWVTEHPKASHDEGWTRNSWDHGDEVAP